MSKNTDTLSKTTKSKWNKKEPIPCYDCGMPSCSQVGNERRWYCFRCIANMDYDDEPEIDNTLQVCHKQLEIQSKEFSY